MSRRSGETEAQYQQRRQERAMQEAQEREEAQAQEAEALTPILLRALRDNLEISLRRVRHYGDESYSLQIKILFTGEQIACEETSLES